MNVEPLSISTISTGTGTNTELYDTSNTTTSIQPTSPKIHYDALSQIPTNLTQFTIIEPGIIIKGDSSGIILNTSSPVDQNISFNLSQNVTIISDTSCELSLVEQIRDCASQINCTDFYGKGTIDDYTVLFNAASQFVNNTTQVELDVQVDGFNQFAQAADDLSTLFVNFTKQLQNVNIIKDDIFLTTILNSLQRIINLKNTFGKFTETIKATNTIQLSNSISETKQILEEVTNEIDCAMNYITHFTTNSSNIPSASLSDIDKNAIERSAQTLNAWSEICNHGVSIAMVNDPNIQYIQSSNQYFMSQSKLLQQSTSSLRGRYSSYF